MGVERSQQNTRQAEQLDGFPLGQPCPFSILSAG